MLLNLEVVELYSELLHVTMHTALTKKVRRLAVKSALSEKVQETKIHVLDKFEIAEPKTKTFVSIIEAIQAPKKTLFVVADSEDATNVLIST